MRNKAFTLIELLSVIVILSIIFLIATPIILGIIKDAREESYKRSVEMYAKAIENAIAKQQLFNPNEVVSGTFTTTDGRNLKQTGKEDLKIEYDGNVVCEIIQIYEDGNIYLTKCKVNGTFIEYFYGMKQGYENGEVVYFDIENGVGCTIDDYHEENSKTDYNGIDRTANQTSCLKFYAFLDDGSDKINLLLDHNIVRYSNWSYGFNNSNGPTVLLNLLKQNTDKWSDKIITPSTKYGYPVDYKGYKARIITAQEIAHITENTGWDEISLTSTSYYFETLNSSYGNNCTDNNDDTICKYGWLYDRTSNKCKQHGCLNNSDVTTHGYWTASPNVSSSKHVWKVYYKGTLSNQDLDVQEYTGIRPVIEVLKSDL